MAIILFRAACMAGPLAVMCHSGTAADRALKYHDNSADGKKSLGGSGEIIAFGLPGGGEIAGLRVHGSRYGSPQPPKESFLFYFLNEEMDDVIAARLAPYSKFERGSEKWVYLKFEKPVEVPENFRVAIDFRAAQTKGVYVSFDSSTTGEHSFVVCRECPRVPLSWAATG
ncbi:MAG: hypothetical protein M3552_00265 [Planctomycetota bacterium]|nr:hypothetical protein [Planctomycetota bacterium]